MDAPCSVERYNLFKETTRPRLIIIYRMKSSSTADRFKEALQRHESLKDWTEDLFLRCRAAALKARDAINAARQVRAFKRRMSIRDVARD